MTVNENPKEYMKMEEEPVHSPAAAGAREVHSDWAPVLCWCARGARLGAQRLGAW